MLMQNFGGTNKEYYGIFDAVQLHFSSTQQLLVYI